MPTEIAAPTGMVPVPAIRDMRRQRWSVIDKTREMVWNPPHVVQSSEDETSHRWTPRCSCGWEVPSVESQKAARSAYREHLKALHLLSQTAIH